MSSLNPDQWRFTFETLAHLPTLRLYLFNPALNPSIQCLNLTSRLHLPQSLLVVSWVDSLKSEQVSVRVPVPRVLIDPDAEVETRIRDDHVEIKMRLVLPVNHPFVVNLMRGGGGEVGSDGDLDRFRPIELGSDLKNLSSGDVQLYCKACSTRLTKRPLSGFMEMPSVNWREVADNWFGACCCSFGGISEKLVLQYIKTYDCTEGTCLLDDASVIVSKDDIEGYTFQHNLDRPSDSNYEVDLEPNGNLTGAMKESNREATIHDLLFIEKYNLAQLSLQETQSTVVDDSLRLNHGSGNPEEPIPQSRNELSSNGHYHCCPNEHESNFEVNLEQTGNLIGAVKESNREMTVHDLLFTEKCSLAQLSLHEKPSTLPVEPSKLNHAFGNLEEPIPQSRDELSSRGHYHCCPNEHENCHQLLENSRPERIQKWLHDCSLGSGFFTRTSNLSNDVDWVEFLCRNCSSILGAYPSYNSENVPIDGGIRLYKCYLSTSIPVDGPHDIFRKHTLERLFASLLLEGAMDELSYRIVLRDLRTKSPMLQIVLLNSESWCFSGYCTENTTMKIQQEVDLKPVVKVLFSDCSTATEASLRIIKDWSSKTHTEEVYMMSHHIVELAKCLKSAADRLPRSCSYLQGMSLSSIER